MKKNISLWLFLTLCAHATIAQNGPSPHLTITSVSVSCNDKADGVINVVNSSQKIYSHQLIRSVDKSAVLSNHTTESVLTELPAGSYYVSSFYAEDDGTVKTFTSK